MVITALDADCDPIAAEVLYVDTPGLTGGDIIELPFTKIRRPMWPFDDDPFAEPTARGVESSGEKPMVFIAGIGPTPVWWTV